MLVESLITEVADGLVEVFYTPVDLDTFLQNKLNLTLARITTPANLDNLVLQVVRYLEPRGRLAEFLECAAVEFPSVRAVADRVIPLLKGPRRPEPPDPIKNAIAALIVQIEQRQQSFGFLNAYKGLHDVLHGLHRAYGVIELAAQTRMRDASQSLSEDATSLIATWIDEANECCDDLEISDSKPDWIESLGLCLEALSGCQTERWDWALVELKGLPAREMRPLNDQLVATANKLKFRELVECSSALLTLLAQSKDKELQELFKTVEVFYVRSVRIVYLVRIHNLCQLIDERLPDPASPILQANGKFPDLVSIGMRLGDLKKLMSADPAEIARLGTWSNAS